MSRIIGIVVAMLLTIGFAACGGSSGGGGGGNAGTVTISGTLATEASPSISPMKSGGFPVSFATAASYPVQIINTTDGSQSYTTTGADGSFSFDVDSGDSVIVNFLNNDYSHQGILVVESGTGSVTTGLSTTSASATTSLGTVTLNTATGVATAAADITALADSTYQGEDANGDGAPDGATNYGGLTSGVSASYSNTYDADGDGIPDMDDVDDDNNGIFDDQDGVTTAPLCEGLDQIVLFVNNKRDLASLTSDATGSNYIITQHLYPADGKTISTVSVAGPSYLDDLAVGNASAVYDTPVTEGSTWDKTLVSCNGGENHCIFVSGSETTSLADEMAAGDLFVYTVTFDDATSVTCSRMINSVLGLTPQNIRIGDDDATVPGDFTSVTSVSGVAVDADNDNLIKLLFDIPAGMQLGFTYRFDGFAYAAGCAEGGSSIPVMVDIDATFTGDTRTAATDSLSDVEVLIDLSDADWPTSAISAWKFDVTAQDSVGDNSAAQGISIYKAIGGTECP